jgi:hypothetical protein
VFGTEGNERLTIAAGTTLILDASFNRGGDTITLAGNAASYTVTKRGSSVILTDAAGSVTIPVGVVGGNIVFADAAARSLVSTTTGAFTLGSQPVTETAAAVTAGTVAPAGSAFILSTGVDTGDGFTGTARYPFDSYRRYRRRAEIHLSGKGHVRILSDRRRLPERLAYIHARTRSERLCWDTPIRLHGMESEVEVANTGEGRPGCYSHNPHVRGYDYLAPAVERE